MSYFDINGAKFNDQFRMIEKTDPVDADFMNGLLRQLLYNDVALRDASGMFAGSKNEQAEFLLNLRKDGLLYGVHWDAFGTSPSAIGTRLYDNVGKVCKPSTDTVRATNDLEGTSVFFHLEVNGYVDAEGEFQVEYIKGIDNEFDNKTKDTWCLFLTQWIRIEISANGENKILSDTRFDGSFPEGGAIRPDRTVRPFVAIAKYQVSDGEDGNYASVSGKSPAYNCSHNSLITKMHAKGTQYCATTVQDWERMNNLMEVAFATRNSQSVMYGTYSYSGQYAATVVENDVERIVISKSQAANLIVGSRVSIGNATSLSNGAPNNDRGYSGLNAKANRVIITKIEEYDASNSAVYVDNGGVKFSTGANLVDGVSCPTIISTMPWHTGTCDNVLGSCGSMTSNTDGKHPYILFGVEYALGQYEVCGNAKMNIVNGVMQPYVCYDSVNLSSGAPSEHYVAVGYTVALTDNTWKYISELGYDPDNPMARFGIGVEATSSTGYCDGQHTGTVDETTNTQREILLGGNLDNGTFAGRRCAYLVHGLTFAYWGIAARLSASGRCAQAA